MENRMYGFEACSIPTTCFNDSNILTTNSCDKLKGILGVMIKEDVWNKMRERGDKMKVS